MGIQIENRVGPEVKTPAGSLVTLSKAVIIGNPKNDGGFVWNWPQAVMLTTPSGEEQLVPIYDITRRIQLAWIALGLIGAILVWLARK